MRPREKTQQSDLQTMYKELNMRERIISNDDLDVNENELERQKSNRFR